MKTESDSEKIKQAVRKNYSAIAGRFIEQPKVISCCGPRIDEKNAKGQLERCCSPSETPIDGNESAKLYIVEEISNLPESVTNAALGCGNPTAIAGLALGETVLDLGSGGGIDCFLAARKVGPQGKVIGLDMTPEMIKLARQNAKKIGATNVDFRYGEMEDIPLPDESVDVILSNCVINLSPDKDAVFNEAFRVLRQGGRMSISDIVVDGDLPESVRSQIDAWAGCIAGALDEKVYLDKIRKAGFEDISVNSRTFIKLGDGNEWEQIKQLMIQADIPAEDLNCRVASIQVTARKKRD